MNDHRKEPDLVVDQPPEGFKALNPALNGKQIRTPQIAWGHEYKAWPDRRKIIYLEKLASSMNHAADVLQQERNRGHEVIEHLKKQLKASTERHAKEIAVLHQRFQDFNEGRQVLLRKNVELEELVRRHANKLEDLAGGALD